MEPQCPTVKKRCAYGFKPDLNISDGNSSVNSTKPWETWWENKDIYSGISSDKPTCRQHATVQLHIHSEMIRLFGSLAPLCLCTSRLYVRARACADYRVLFTCLSSLYRIVLHSSTCASLLDTRRSQCLHEKTPHLPSTYSPLPPPPPTNPPPRLLSCKGSEGILG